MKYLKQILLASLVLSLVILTSGAAAAEVGIPFGLKWGDSPETVEKTCKKLFGECTKKADTEEETLEITSEITLENYRFRIVFYFYPQEKLDSIFVTRAIQFENQLLKKEFENVINKYFFYPFDSLSNYRKVTTTKYNTVYITPNSRITVAFGPVEKNIDKEGKKFLLFVTWAPLNVEKFFIE